MKSRRPHKNQEKEKQKTASIANEEDVQVNPDKHIDQHFPGYPHRGTITMDMPEVKDIEGQENIRPPHIGEMMDTTISSADEEGEGLLDDLNKDDADYDALDDYSNVSESELSLLSMTDRPLTEEGKDRNKLALDKSDGADLLNERSDPSADMGGDLDILGVELDNEDEEIGEEDEENNSYSRPD